MKILITGGTGFIGSALSRRLTAKGHEVGVLSRHPASVAGRCGASVKAIASLAQLTPDDGWQAVINLAGEPILGSRWTPARKQRIRDSRIKLTQALVDYLATTVNKPTVLISGSAIGYYGDQGDTPLTEQAPPRENFSHRLCRDWEQAARAAESLGIRVCLPRAGVVIGRSGGLLQRLILPFQLGLGGRLGDGRQWLSWIHLDDWISIAEAMIDNPSMQGAYNVTAPNPVTNAEFTAILAQCLKRPALLPVPAWLLKTLLGEMSELLLGSQRVLPARLTEQGQRFQYPELAQAIRSCL